MWSHIKWLVSTRRRTEPGIESKVVGSPPITHPLRVRNFSLRALGGSLPAVFLPVRTGIAPSLLVGLMLMLGLGSCAENECNFHSQCGPLRYCQGGGCFQDCALDTDCQPNEMCSAIGQCEPRFDGGPGFDAGQDSGPTRDVGPFDGALPDVPPTPDGGPPFDGGQDAGPPPFDGGRDAGPPPFDGGRDAGTDSGPLGARFDPCTFASDCVSDFCIEGRCTISCVANNDCADHEVCQSGVCTDDDTGATCSVATPETCRLDLCLGPPDAPGACTRPCTSARDCPAGFACTTAGGSPTPICVEIERPCTGPAECGTGLCFPTEGCTATCRTASDCPMRATALGVAAYTCEVVSGVTDPVCVPPADILGAQRMGETCPAAGTNMCRSGLCNPSSPGGPMCIQTCTAQGGCPPGFGCKPEELDGGTIAFFCARSGSREIGEACTRASDCETALCNAPGYCTRLCEDGLCPTGFRCDPIPTTASRMCVRL